MKPVNEHIPLITLFLLVSLSLTSPSLHAQETTPTKYGQPGLSIIDLLLLTEQQNDVAEKCARPIADSKSPIDYKEKINLANWYLDLAQLLANAGKTEEALKYYLKAYELGRTQYPIRLRALSSIEKIIENKDKGLFQKTRDIISPIIPIALILVSVVLLVIILRIILSIFNNSLELAEIDDFSDFKYGKDFFSLFSSIYDQMGRLRDETIFGETRNLGLPHIVLLEYAETIPAINAQIGAFTISNVLQLFKRCFWAPSLKLKGSAHASQNHLILNICLFNRSFFSLIYRKKTIWRKEFPVTNGGIPPNLLDLFALEIIYTISET
jgi:hypothetical protein